MAIRHYSKKTYQGRWYGVALVLVIIGVAGYVIWDAQQVQQKTDRLLSASGASESKEVQGEHAKEGSDTTDVKSEAVSGYQVAGDAPRLLTINKLGMQARIQPMGVNGDNSIQAPININDAGWYTGSAKPGADGAVFIDGHSSGDTRFGLFGNLDKVSIGDAIEIERGDYSTLKYNVVHTEKVALKDVDMQKALTPYKGVKKGLTLMTCTGAWAKDSATLDHRLIVYAEQL